MTRFEGFGEHAVDFYDGLVADNSKSYWTDHKAVYQADVREPMEALLAELSAEFAADFGRATVFRPYRDVRFAKDKTPYKTHCGGVIEPGRGAGAYYVELSPAGVRVGGGCFHLQSDQLARFRTAVAEDLHGEALAGILTKLEKAGWELQGRPAGHQAARLPGRPPAARPAALPLGPRQPHLAAGRRAARAGAARPGPHGVAGAAPVQRVGS